MDLILRHPLLIRLIKLLDKTTGRDKVLRFVQYLLKFLSFYYHRSWLNSVSSQLTNCRKSIRVGKPLSHLTLAGALFEDKLTHSSTLRYLLVLKELSYANYLSLDSIVWFKNIGLIANSKKINRIERLSSLAWFTGVSTNLVISAIKLYRTQYKLKQLQLESESDLKYNSKELQAQMLTQKQIIKRRILWDILDLTIVSNKLNFIAVDDGIVGFCGTITSWFGIEDIWDAIN